MSDTKRMLGRKSRDIGRQNRSKIYFTLARKYLTFTELLEETKLSRAALSSHLKALENENRIERTIRGKAVAYKSKTTKENIVSEIRAYLEPLEELVSIVDRQKKQFYTHLVLHFFPEYIEFMINGERSQQEIKEFIEDWFSDIGESTNGSG